MVHLYLFTENHCVEWYVSNIPDREDLYRHMIGAKTSDTLPSGRFV